MLLRNLYLTLTMLSATIYAGEYADAFMLAGAYPHAQSMGNSTVALSVASGYALNNPAGLAYLSHQQVSMVYDQFNGLSNNYGIELQLPASENYTIGLTAIHTSIGDLYSRPNLSNLPSEIRRDSVLSLAGTSGDLITYREDALFLSLAREFEFELNLGWKLFKIPVKMPVGASIKYIDKLLVENRGLGSGIDLGTQFCFSLAGMSRRLSKTDFSFGLFLSDILNTPVYWDTEHQDAIKRNLTKGYSIRQQFDKYSTEILFSSSTQTRYPDKTQYGIEIKVRKVLAVRGGYDGYIPSFGLGISLKKFIIAYSFSQYDLAGMQKIGIDYHF